MHNPLISVIMPVYGVEKYLETAVNSVLNQTYKNFELILVDDCSPDNCPGICDSLAKKDNRITVIHKPENQGLGFARNTGYDNAKGEFILFIDSDDYIESNLIEKALSAFGEETEMVVFGFSRVHEDENGNIKKIEKLTPEAAASEAAYETAAIFTMLNRTKTFPFAWNKLYKKSFLDKCETVFEKTKLIEDFLFNIDLFSKAVFIKVIPDNLYCYRKPAHETLASSYSPDFFELCKRKYSLEREYLKTVEAETDENLQLIYFSYIKHLISVFLKNRSKKAGLSSKEQKKRIKSAIKDPMTRQVLDNYTPKGLIMKVVAFILKTNSAFLCSLFVSTAGVLINKK